MKVNHFIALVTHFLYSVKRSPYRLFEIVFYLSIELSYFGLLSRFIEKTNSAYISLSTGIVVGIVFIAFFTRVMQENLAQLFDDMGTKNMRHLLIAPVTIIDIALASIVSSFIKLLVSFMVPSVLLVFAFPSFFSVLSVFSFIWIIIIVLFASAVSFCITGLMFVFGERIHFVGWVTASVVTILSCVVYARSLLPQPLFAVSFALPPSFVFESVRATFLNGSFSGDGLFVGLVLSVTYCVIGVWIMYALFNVARKTGSLIHV
jgi:ABC-2 type transport system permease protein